MTNLAVLTYGRESEYQRAILAVLSCHAWLAAGGGAAELGRTIVYTDNPDYLRPYLRGLPTDFRPLTPAIRRELIGPLNYIHRLKASVVDQSLRDYPADKLLFIDADTFFFADPAPLLARIAPSVSLMDQREFQLEERRNDPHGGRLLARLEAGPVRTSRGDEQFGARLYCWNSGVLGLHPQVREFMPDVLEINDEFFRYSQWNISEQVAFSLILQTRGSLVPSNAYVQHYWLNLEKAVMDVLLPRLLTAELAVLPLPDRLARIRQATAALPDQLAAYPRAHPGVELRSRALADFLRQNYLTGCLTAARYLVKEPTDTTFLREIGWVLRGKALPRPAK